MNKREVLMAARSLIDTPDKWCQNYNCISEGIDDTDNPKVVSRCMSQAIRDVFEFPSPLNDVRETEVALAKHLPINVLGYVPPAGMARTSITSFNDKKSTTHECVIEVFDKAIQAEGKVPS